MDLFKRLFIIDFNKNISLKKLREMILFRTNACLASMSYGLLKTLKNSQSIWSHEEII